MKSTGEIIQAFRHAMQGAGLTPPDRIEPDGTIHRFQVEGDRSGSANGWYLLHRDCARWIPWPTRDLARGVRA